MTAYCPICREVSENCLRIQESSTQQVNAYKAAMLDSSQALRQQSKGMKRMARKIKRLQALLRGTP